MSRAAFIYKSKWQMQKMTVKQLAAYIRTLEQRAHIGGYVTKSAQKQLETAHKIFSGRLAKALTGDV